MEHSICGANCAVCGLRDHCNGCAKTGGCPFGKQCMIASYSQKGQLQKLKDRLIAEFRALNLDGMGELTDLNALKGSFINLEYTLPGGQTVKFWDDDKIYLGNQLCKSGSNRCYGVAADDNYLMVCEYGDGGSAPEIVIWKRWNSEKEHRE